MVFPYHPTIIKSVIWTTPPAVAYFLSHTFKELMCGLNQNRSDILCASGKYTTINTTLITTDKDSARGYCIVEVSIWYFEVFILNKNGCLRLWNERKNKSERTVKILTASYLFVIIWSLLFSFIWVDRFFMTWKKSGKLRGTFGTCWLNIWQKYEFDDMNKKSYYYIFIFFQNRSENLCYD